jgi:hypothetical protein
MKHTSGTSITDHTDLFEKLCGQIISSDQPPTEEKIDWFMDSITEPIYEYTKQHCKHLRLLGTLTYPMMANLYNLNCFEKYPHFHVKAQNGMDGKSLTNNSRNTSHGRGRGKGKGQGRNRDQERDKGRGDRQSKGNSKDGGETKATQANDTTEKSPKKSHKERVQNVTAITAISQDTSAENAEKG